MTGKQERQEEKNDKKICFIICYNDALFFEECCFYLRALHVPDGMETEILGISGASSMTEGYQNAMESSDARYKVYLHQDTFIINKYFLDAILDIFTDESIGMIGMVGSISLPRDAVMWNNEMRCGKVRLNAVMKEFIFELPVPVEEKYREVQAIDGFLMATSVDVPWRQDLFQGWHFYDISQSMEMRKRGYRVVVPRQDEAWCLHDIDVKSGKEGRDAYHYWRDVFLDNYQI